MGKAFLISHGGHVNWDEVLDKPDEYTPEDHRHNTDEIDGISAYALEEEFVLVTEAEIDDILDS